MTEDPRLNHDAHDDHEADADQRLAHGLLRFLREDTPLEQERRVSRAMDAIGDAPAPRRGRWRLGPLPVGAGIAAAVLIVIGVLVGTPTQPAALAMVENAIEASSAAGDRRYEIRAQLPHDDALPTAPSATLDVRDPSRVFIGLTTPRGDRVAVGRTPDGEWAITPDGSVKRFNTRRAWPRWINLGDAVMLVESVDDLLADLTRDYELSDPERRPLPEPFADEPFGQLIAITATTRNTEGPAPETIELWIDEASAVVRHMELTWSDEARGGLRPQAKPQNKPDARESDLAPDGPDGSRSDRRRPPPPRGDVGEGGPRGAGSPHRPRPPRDGRPGRLHPPPLDTDAEADGRPRPPRADGDDRPPPRFIDGPARFRGGHHPPPPQRISLHLVPADPFPDGWFEAEAHLPVGE